MTASIVDFRSILIAGSLALALALPATGQELLPGMEPCAECGYFGPAEGEVRSAYVPPEGYPPQAAAPDTVVAAPVPTPAADQPMGAVAAAVMPAR